MDFAADIVMTYENGKHTFYWISRLVIAIGLLVQGTLEAF